MAGQTLLFTILAAVVALGLSLLFYFYNSTKKRSKHWIIFSVLRFLSLFSLFLLLINPKLETLELSTEKPNLVFAVDNSSSIAYFKEEENVRSFLQQIEEHKALQEKFKVDYYSFGSQIKKLDTLSFTENKTQITPLFDNLTEIYADQVTPTILITDGNQTYGQDYLYKVKQYPQDLYAVAVGDTTSYSDLKIERVNVNKYAYLNNKFPVEVFLSYTGEEPIQKEVKIELGNSKVFSKKISFSKENNSEILQVNLPANRVGLLSYTITAETIENEKNTSNNTKKFLVEVIDEKTNVLILASYLHPDLGAFKKAIESNQQREASIQLISDFNGSLLYYQLVLLYQPTSAFKNVFDQIRKEKLNSLIVTGTKTDYQFLNKSQEFFRKEIYTQLEEFQPSYHSGYSSFQQPDIQFSSFPPLKDYFGEVAFETAPQVLLYQNINGVKTNLPIIATTEKNQQKIGFLFGENTWQWRSKSYVQQKSYESYDDFFGRLIQYLSSNQCRERLTIDAQPFYNYGDKISIIAGYFDKNYAFDDRAKLEISLQEEESEEKFQYPFILQSHSYEVNLSQLQPSTYTYKVTVEEENIQKTGSFTIVDFEVEKQFLNAHVAQLQKISKDSVYFLSQGEALLNQLVASKDYQPVQKSAVKKSSLIDWKILLGIIILCLSAEWFLRKYKGLI
ncbi:VWA domain-containing protein [Mesonia sp. MT50]|uniref:VWA domain-containing protein n=1 Tax=Mesonia profundi TaxID=3070998 RepID=A0ABU1A3N5_9FLAO|nr:VWA domain-containing protein [Mesonia profundi]MDQ7918323.1 VWA domain-containing protein [Mesonia profundi]